MRKIILIVFMMFLLTACNSNTVDNEDVHENEVTAQEEKEDSQGDNLIGNVNVNDENDNIEETSTSENNQSTINDSANLSILTKISEENGSKILELYKVNKSTGDETFLCIIEDAYINHYHGQEISNNHLYVIKRVDYEGYPDDDWSDELWRYTIDGFGERVFYNRGLYSDNKGIDFRVSPNENSIVIRTGTLDDKLVFIDYYGNLVKDYDISELKVNDSESLINLLDWSFDSNFFGGEITMTSIVYSFFRVNIENFEVDKYDLANIDLSSEYNLNASKEMLVYSDYPIMFDVDEYDSFINSDRTVNLYLHDLKTDEKILIASSITKEFNPIWTNINTFEYNNPDGDDRIIYEVK